MFHSDVDIEFESKDELTVTLERISARLDVIEEHLGLATGTQLSSVAARSNPDKPPRGTRQQPGD